MEENGYRATAVNDSSEALALFKSNPNYYSLVITDQTMPRLTGTELITEIRKISPEQPVILCTGYSDKVDSGIARELDIPFFDKPIDMTKLVTTISMLLTK